MRRVQHRRVRGACTDGPPTRRGKRRPNALATVLTLLADVANVRGRYEEWARVAQLGLEHARLAGQQRSELFRFATALAVGPLPADEAPPRARLAALDDVSAVDVLPSCRAPRHARPLRRGAVGCGAGSASCSVSREPSGVSTRLATRRRARGDSETACRHWRIVCDWLEATKQNAFLGSRTHLCSGIELCRLRRIDEAEDLRAAGAGALRPERRDRTGALAAGAGARRVAARAPRRAERLAREALALTERTDSLAFQGDALSDLAEVLLGAGRAEEATAALAQALERYERKGILPLARRVRERLEDAAAGTRRDRRSRRARPQNQERCFLLSMPFGALARPSLALGLLAATADAWVSTATSAISPSRSRSSSGSDEYRLAERRTSRTRRSRASGSSPRRSTVREPGRRRRRMSTRCCAGSGTSATMPSTRVRQAARRGRAVPRALPRRDRLGRYTLVGFTSMFQQNIASLALAARVKAAYPHLTIAFGGANWEDPMGVALQRRVPVRRSRLLRRGRRLVPGHARGAAARSASTAPRRRRAQARLPTSISCRSPTSTPYFEQLRSLDRRRGLDAAAAHRDGARLLVGRALALHVLRPQRLDDGLPQQVARARRSRRSRISATGTASERFWVVDNILDMRYFQTVLPDARSRRPRRRALLGGEGEPVGEARAPLRAAGVRSIQPGIESLSDHVLALMRKGTTGLKNIELLKWCREYGVKPLWNLLYGFPGETAADYEETRAAHRGDLASRAAQACGRVRLDRFSPYHADPEAFGMENVRPKAPLLAPLSVPTRGRDGDRLLLRLRLRTTGGARTPCRARPRAGARVDGGRRPRRCSPSRADEDGTVHLVDSRRPEVAPERIVLDGLASRVYPRLRPRDEPARADAATGRPAALGLRERPPRLPRRLRARRADGPQRAVVAERRSPRSRPLGARTGPIDRFRSRRIIASP